MPSRRRPASPSLTPAVRQHCGDLDHQEGHHAHQRQYIHRHRQLAPRRGQQFFQCEGGILILQAGSALLAVAAQCRLPGCAKQLLIGRELCFCRCYQRPQRQRQRTWNAAAHTKNAAIQNRKQASSQSSSRLQNLHTGGSVGQTSINGREKLAVGWFFVAVYV